MKKESFRVKLQHEGKKLFIVISDHLKISKKKAQALIDDKRILVNGKRVWIRNHLLNEDDKIEILFYQKSIVSKKNLSILWQDDNYIIVNKSSGVITNSNSKSLEKMLQEKLHNPNIIAVHRLDKETSGCILFAMTLNAKKAAIPMFRENKIIKVYRALTIGKFPNSWREIRTDIDGYIATTIVKILDSNRQSSYLELRIETGRTHQIRRHLANKRHPVLGDKKYAGTGNEISLSQPRHMLHAYRLIFPHPITQKTIRVTAPLPVDIKKALHQLKLN